MAYLGTAWRSSLQIGQSAGTFARGASCTPQALHMCACSARSMSIATVGGLAILQHPADCGVEVQIVEWKFGLWRAVQCIAPASHLPLVRRRGDTSDRDDLASFCAFFGVIIYGVSVINGVPGY
jgi:hypothetical protein